jgi:hydrogenase maturation protein HypF
VLGLAWDGTGFGPDGAVWGGEALVCEAARFVRVAHLRSFALPGGERAVREPRRAALGLLHALGDVEPARQLGRAWFEGRELDVLLQMLERRVQAPRTTSIGRLFDAVSALAGLRAQVSFEGQAAMALEFALEDGAGAAGAYPLPLGDGSPAVLDWEPLVRALLQDGARGVPVAVRSARFHAALVEAGLAIARRVGLPHVVLGGGCFQNAALLEGLRGALQGAGFRVYTPVQVPPNDGGLALGQVLVAAATAPGVAPDEGRRARVPGHSR